MSFHADLQIFDKFSISGNNKSSEKLTEMLSEVDTSPSMQEKMKVAFAEGYLASDKKKADPEASWSALPRRIVRFALIIVTIWLFFQFLQTYSALGGSMFSSVCHLLCTCICSVNVLSMFIILKHLQWGC